jgi:methionyl-tRNA synthetase
MSKTRGNGLDPYPVIATYGVDALRYYLLREVAFGQDGSVGVATLHDRYHAELANDLGNLVSRTTAMIVRYRDGVLPDAPVAAAIRDEGEQAALAYAERMDELDFTGALERAWLLVRALNRFVEERAPWKLARADDAESRAALDETLVSLADGVRLAAVLLANVMPQAAERALAAVGEDPSAIAWERARPGLLAAGATVDAAAGPLFPRVERPAEVA